MEKAYLNGMVHIMERGNREQTRRRGFGRKWKHNFGGVLGLEDGEEGGGGGKL